jgi:glycosyltransferase involved in cell wall biosynthesis
MFMLPRVSIITPAYNAADYLSETAESVLAQDYPDFEYIVVDDGSTDGGGEQLGRLRRHVHIIRQSNGGEQRAVSRGVAAASGDIIGVVNADDPILPGLLRAGVESLLADPGLAGAYPNWLKIDEDGCVLEVVRLPEYDYERMLTRHLCDIGPGCLFRRQALQGEPPRDPRFRYSGDFQQWLRMGLHRPFARIPDVLATWRFHAAGTSQDSMHAGLAADKVAIIRDLFRRDDVPTAVRALEGQALSAAHFAAALLAVNNPAIPARGHMLRSLLASPRWRGPATPERRRTWRLVVYALGLPLTRPLRHWYRAGRGYAPVIGLHAPGVHYRAWRSRQVAADECAQ